MLYFLTCKRFWIKELKVLVAKYHNAFSAQVVKILVWLVGFIGFSLIWRRTHYRWRAIDFDLCSALMTIEQWGFFSVHANCDTGPPFIMVISKDPWHSHLLQWSCHFLFIRLDLWPVGFEHPILITIQNATPFFFKFELSYKLWKQNRHYCLHVYLCVCTVYLCMGVRCCFDCY